MKRSIGYQLAVAALWVLHVFGASALIITLLALCGVQMNWWIGALCVVPGWLILKGLQWYFTYEYRKNQKKAIAATKEAVKKAVEEMLTEEEQGPEEKSENKAEECRFREGDVIPNVSLIVSCEDASVQYLEFPDGLRLIFHEKEYVGWYRWE